MPVLLEGEKARQSGAGALFAAEQEDYVEEDEDGDDYFEGEHAALVELGDHEIVEFAGGF
jgi:hypothetical protein